LTNAREYAAFVIDEALAIAETQRLLCLQSSSCIGLMQRGRVAAAYLFLHLMRREDRMALEQNEEAAEAYRMLGIRLGTLIPDRARNLG